ncbi:hypothetical protein [Paenibacillus taichungensis]|uniref:hypothetical protein n=1 Tax=Paenibacillus taichungensis TaxID=484184 RepID=UPI0039A46CBE
MESFFKSLYGVAYFAISIVLVAITVLLFVTGIRLFMKKSNRGFAISCILFACFIVFIIVVMLTTPFSSTPPGSPEAMAALLKIG